MSIKMNLNKTKQIKQTLLNFPKRDSNINNLSQVVPSRSPQSVAAQNSFNQFTELPDNSLILQEIGKFDKTAKINDLNAPLIPAPLNISLTNNVVDDVMEICDEVLTSQNNTQECINKKKSKSTADRNFYSNWLTIFSWLTKKKGRAFCKFCEQSLPNNFSLLKRQNDSESHVNLVNILKNQTLIDEIDVEEQRFTTKQKVADFSLIDSLVDLVKSIDPESKICQKLKFSRTKGTGTITSLFAEEGTNKISKILKSQPFSIIIDETTDISSKKCLAIIARYFDQMTNKTKDSFLTLLELENLDAQSVYKCMGDFFARYEIPINNLIGFGADNASVMMGKSAGVQAYLPEECEKLARNIYHYFSHSSKRQNDFKQFQTNFNIPIHKIMKTSTTRWLALEGVILRLLEQWQPLKHYFLLEKFEAKHLYKNVACDISDQLSSRNLIYFNFLSYILKLTNNLNKEFQSEQPKIYKLLSSVKSFLLTVLHNFIKNEYIDEHNLDNLPKAELEIQKCNLSIEIVSAIKENCKRYYIKLCDQIITRFDFKDETLVHIQAIDPDKPGSTLIPLINLFPHLCEDRVDETEEEFRSVIFQKFVPSSHHLEEFWGKVFEIKNGIGEFRFPNLKHFIGGLLSLPHSSAAAERCFSQLSNIKTKNRNCLKTETINALITAKQLAEDCLLYDWKPSKNLIRKYNLA